MPGAASPWLRGLIGAAAGVCRLKSSSREVSGVVGEVAAVLTALLFVTLVIISTESGGILDPVPGSRFGENSFLCSYIQILHNVGSPSAPNKMYVQSSSFATVS